MNDTKSNLPWYKGWQGCVGAGLPWHSTSHIYWLIIEGSLEMSPRWHPARQMGIMTVREGVRTQPISQDCSHGGRLEKGRQLAGCTGPRPLTQTQVLLLHPFVMTSIRPFLLQAHDVRLLDVAFLKPGSGRAELGVERFGLLTCCVAVGESYFLGLCAFSL